MSAEYPELGLRIVESQWVPPNTVFLISPGMFDLSTGPVRLDEDLWDEAPSGFTVAAQWERRRGLDHLASLLDGLCLQIGLSPEDVWREPRRAERRAATWEIGNVAYRAGLRAAIAIDRPGAFLRIDGAS